MQIWDNTLAEAVVDCKFIVRQPFSAYHKEIFEGGSQMMNVNEKLYQKMPDEQAAALLQCKQPLKELFEMWRDRDGIPSDAFLDAVQEYVAGKIGGQEEA